MKNRLLTAAALCLLAFSASATKHNVSVANFQFTPSTLSFPLGDTIVWNWVNGSHTTTSLGIPAGAASWDQDIKSSSITFMYVPTVVGTYNYECTPHSPDMPASFTVTAPTGISDLVNADGIKTYPVPAQSVLHISLNTYTQPVSVVLMDISGRPVFNSMINSKESEINTAAMANGMYFLRIGNGSNVSLRQVSIAH